MILLSIGVLIIVGIFIGIFVMVAGTTGWKAALGIFGMAIGVTALVVLALMLIGAGLDQV